MLVARAELVQPCDSRTELETTMKNITLAALIESARTHEPVFEVLEEKPKTRQVAFVCGSSGIITLQSQAPRFLDALLSLTPIDQVAIITEISVLIPELGDRLRVTDERGTGPGHKLDFRNIHEVTLSGEFHKTIIVLPA